MKRDVKWILMIQIFGEGMIGNIRKYEREVSAKINEIRWFEMSEKRMLHSIILYNKIIY